MHTKKKRNQTGLSCFYYPGRTIKKEEEWRQITSLVYEQPVSSRFVKRYVPSLQLQTLG